MADIAIVLFDGEGQILARVELIFRYKPVIAFPVAGNESLSFYSGLFGKLLAGCIIAFSKLPRDSCFSNWIESSP